MRTLLAACALCLAATIATAADLGPVITTTDGKVYVKAADGHYYPSGSVPVPQQMPAPKAACACGDYCGCKLTRRVHPNCLCDGACECPTAPARVPAYLPASVTGGCANGQCGVPPAPARRVFRR